MRQQNAGTPMDYPKGDVFWNSWDRYFATSMDIAKNMQTQGLTTRAVPHDSCHVLHHFQQTKKPFC